MHSVSLYNPLPPRRVPIHFGDRVYNNGTDPYYRLVVDLKPEQLEAGNKTIQNTLEQGFKNMEASNRALQTTLEQGFQKLLSLLQASKVTAP